MADLFLELALKVTGFIASLGYWGIGILMAIESCNVPIPSEIILPFGGYLVSTGELHFFPAALAGATGGTAGSVLSYYIGLWGGRPFLFRYGKYCGLTPARLNTAESWFLRYGDVAVFFSRLLPGVRTFISLPAGAARMKMLPFLIYTFVGSLIWSLALTYCGYLLGENWELVRTWFHRFDLILLVGVVLLVAWYIWKRRR